MKKGTVGFLILSLAIVPPCLLAEEIPYDRYGPEGREGPLLERSSAPGEALASFGQHFLVYPFELVRWPIDKTLVFVEDHRLYDKTDWIYEQMKEYGLTPYLYSVLGVDSFGGGLKLELTRLTQLKDRYPNFTVKGTSLWTVSHIADYQAEIKQERIGGTGFFLGGKVRYENRGEEHFYGIGPDTSLGDGTSFRLEKTTFAIPLGSELTDTWKVMGKFAYENVNITNGEDGGRGIIDEIFVRNRNQRIPGLGGDEILKWVWELEHDNRDSEDRPAKGGYERLQFSYNKGMDASSGFFKYRAEAAHFFPLFSERRTLAIRGLVEHNDEAGDRDVPFFHMARLGGYGRPYPRPGETHRGFRRDRFYDESLILLNLEYRWTVWEYRELKMDTVLFWDEGQVFGEWSDFQFKDFMASFGIGFRVSREGNVFLTLELARSHEGMEFYVQTNAPF